MWYVHGTIVLDRILGVSRAKSICVYFSDARAKPSRDDLIGILKVSPESTFVFANTPPVVCFDYQRSVIASDGSFADLLTNTRDYTPALPLSAEPLTYELSVADTVDLWCAQADYPELRISDALYRRLIADMRHFIVLARTFPELDVLLESCGVYSSAELHVPDFPSPEGRKP
jgi:hypothetical protein